MHQTTLPSEIKQKLAHYRQQHLLNHIDQMPQEQKGRFIEDLSGIDFELISRLYNTNQKAARGTGEKIFEEADVLRCDSETEKERVSAIGKQAIRQGKVCLFLVAGGQATRLGYDYPKGCFPVSPIKQKSLFQLFAEYIRALQQKLAVVFKWYIMTSSDNHEHTVRFFEKHLFFGLAPDQVTFFSQGQIPSISLEGKLLVSPENRICKNPDGHGGSLFALKNSGALAEMQQLGIEEIFYFQVDNPLVRIADPLFIGAHIDQSADMSTKVVQKTDPDEKVGIIGKINGKPGCIEYSELDDTLKNKRTPDGSLVFGSANTAIHVLNREFVRRLTENRTFSLPYHSAVKQIRCVGLQNNRLNNTTVNGLKFEMFIFDALGFAKNPVTLMVDRAEEFSPVKNRQGEDSPETALASMSDLHRKWLKNSGVNLNGVDTARVEISPLYALNEKEFKEKSNPTKQLHPPLYFE